MSHRGEFDWRAHKRDWDYKRYGGYLDPDDKDIFFGPVTKRELLKSIEVGEAIVKKAREKKRAMLSATKENMENIDSKMNRTFEIADASKNTERHSLNTIFEIDDSQTNLANQLNQSRTSVAAAREPLRDIECPSMVVSTFENLQLGDANVPKQATNTMPSEESWLADESFPKLMSICLPMSPKKKMRTSVAKTPVKKDNSRFERSVVHTPRATKLSDTFITDILAENVLLDSTLPEGNTSENVYNKHQSTPEVFRLKTNEIWRKDTKDVSSLQKLVVADNSFKSKLPKVRKTPVKDKYFFAKSPVAAYIYRGEEIKSMSKLRHDNCAKVEQQATSKSDNKIFKPSGIPLPTFGAAKRRLNMETKSTNTATAARK